MNNFAHHRILTDVWRFQRLSELGKQIREGSYRVPVERVAECILSGLDRADRRTGRAVGTSR